MKVHACRGITGFRCGWLVVPLDRARQTRRTLRLAVGVQQLKRAPRGVLLLLTGGPGQPGVSLIPLVVARLRAAFEGYRLVMFDQRGTGATALRCPALQAAAGASDLTVVPAKTVVACARAVGAARRYFSTPETVADIEALRLALGARRLTLDGVSYGTYVAEHYALTHRNRIDRLVLDSVVPQQGVDPLYLAAIQATARVLRNACAQRDCGWDPAQDVRRLVASDHDGPQLLNALVAESVVVPSFRELLGSMHAAAHGHPRALNRFLAALPSYQRAPADELSQGLHESTLCLDLAAPWNPDAPTGKRARAIARAVAQLSPRSLFPFDRATAYGNGLVQGCLHWPPTEPPAVYAGDASAELPRVPVLLLAGQRDLSTPLSWARAEAAKAPDGKLVIVPGAGHSVQSSARNPAVRTILIRFLRGRD
jgi:pimeloyl-ACP methyl ester carboxylesterase